MIPKIIISKVGCESPTGRFPRSGPMQENPRGDVWWGPSAASGQRGMPGRYAATVTTVGVSHPRVCLVKSNLYKFKICQLILFRMFWSTVF